MRMLRLDDRGRGATDGLIRLSSRTSEGLLFALTFSRWGGDVAGNAWDVIVVGARCAGSPLAMVLAARGHRVLLVDRSTFPSDTVSTHVIHPPGVAALRRWGLLDRV